MKKFIILLTLFSTLLLANARPLVIKSFQTNQEINISDIAQYASNFKAKTQDEEDVNFEIVLFESEEDSTLKQNNKKKYTWLMLELEDNLTSGEYWVEYPDFSFTEHTFRKEQSLNKFSLLGRKIFSFSYDKKEDSRQYFLKAVSSQSHVVAKASLYTPTGFSIWAKEYGFNLLLYFFLFGLIFMTAIYNGAFYLYNREKSFLYYMFMQLFMVGVLIYQTDIVQIYVMGDVENEEIAIFFYFIIVELAIIFILYFIRAFLETKKYLPFHDKVLHYITLFAWIDLVLFFVPIMLIIQIYSFILLYVVVVAVLRFRQGYKPVLFFIFGWSTLMIGVFVSDFFPDYLFAIDPIVIGSTIEALFLAIAISYKMREIRDEKEEQKELLVHQSRLASMGEMVGNIAHQWRQPLTHLGYTLMNIEEAKEHAQLDKAYLTDKIQEANIQIEFMSQTINDFRDFYAPNKAKEKFSLHEATQETLEIMQHTFKSSDIELELLIKEDTILFNYKNEYKQVLLNLLSNAKDILKERSIVNPKVTIILEQGSIKVEDNAGGIPKEILKRVYEPYFTTKEGNSGIGLYMSKMIVERNMGGKLQIANGAKGAICQIEF